MKVRLVTSEDANAICDIYNFYVANTTITFEEKNVDLVEMRRRIENYITYYPWFVCEVDNQLVGYAYATKWKERTAYRHSAEITVYLKNDSVGSGYGTALYKELLSALCKTECHTILAGIALPNESSIKLHENFGFKKVAHFEAVGFKFGKWIDVGYWQKINK